MLRPFRLPHTPRAPKVPLPHRNSAHRHPNNTAADFATSSYLEDKSNQVVLQRVHVDNTFRSSRIPTTRHGTLSPSPLLPSSTYATNTSTASQGRRRFPHDPGRPRPVERRRQERRHGVQQRLHADSAQRGTAEDGDGCAGEAGAPHGRQDFGEGVQVVGAVVLVTAAGLFLVSLEDQFGKTLSVVVVHMLRDRRRRRRRGEGKRWGHSVGGGKHNEVVTTMWKSATPDRVTWLSNEMVRRAKTESAPTREGTMPCFERQH